LSKASLFLFSASAHSSSRLSASFATHQPSKNNAKVSTVKACCCITLVLTAFPFQTHLNNVFR
jgi:hypothetical protein